MKVKTAGGQTIETGEHRISYTSMRLFVSATGAVITMTTTTGVDVAIPLEDFLAVEQESVVAKTKIQNYLVAAFHVSEHELLEDWMADREFVHGLNVWSSYLDDEGDVDRYKVREEAEAWLQQQHS